LACAWSRPLGIHAQARGQLGDLLAGGRLWGDLVRYCAIGEHRTATPEDLRTSQWLVDELRAVGVDASTHAFAVGQQYFPRAHALDVAGAAIECFPLWWTPTTGPRPLVAPLALAPRDAPAGALAGTIALVIVPPDAFASTLPGREMYRRVRQANAAGAAGVVTVTQDRSGEIVAYNAMAGLDLWGVPVISVGQRDEEALLAAAARGARASLLVDGEYRRPVEALEVVGQLTRGPRRIVISTPSSGWFQCAGERGPGIAIWLALARWAAARRSEVSYTFVASPGHEMSGLGIDYFLEHLAPPREHVACWVHLGAGIATYDYEFNDFRPAKLARPFRRRLMSSDQAFIPILRDEFKGIDGLVESFTDRPIGELTAITDRGYRGWGLGGGSAYHHMKKDTPEAVSGPDLLEPIARAAARAIERIETAGGRP
jgi:hypothetical protein